MQIVTFQADPTFGLVSVSKKTRSIVAKQIREHVLRAVVIVRMSSKS